MIDPLLEQTTDRPRGRALARAHRRSDRERIPSRFERWARSKIVSFRVGQTMLYAGTVYFGIQAFITGVPAFDIAAPEGWTPIWAVLLVVGGAVASLGSVSDEKVFEVIELVGVWLLFLTLGCYAIVLLYLGYGLHDNGRATVGSGFLVLSLPAFVRMLWLMSQVPLWRAAKKAEGE